MKPWLILKLQKIKLAMEEIMSTSVLKLNILLIQQNSKICQINMKLLYKTPYHA